MLFLQVFVENTYINQNKPQKQYIFALKIELASWYELVNPIKTVQPRADSSAVIRGL